MLLIHSYYILIIYNSILFYWTLGDRARLTPGDIRRNVFLKICIIGQADSLKNDSDLSYGYVIRVGIDVYINFSFGEWRKTTIMNISSECIMHR